MEAEPIVFEKTFTAPDQQVWAAISEHTEMQNWYFKMDAFEAVEGFKFRFTGGTEKNTYLHLCTVTEVVQKKKLSYTWEYQNFKGSSLVSFELFPAGEQTVLRLTHTGVETFPNDNPDFAPANFVAGWAEIIGTNLAEYLEGKQ